ncbi:serine/threonine-protein kinase [Actinophytocola oryzae]|uniref:non-specific serine/threonine protein kinase n=1 Tax=Actinophytocola oryzae TaxID=502181 RepID=A0A4V3FQP0_9PSEU|nr:serine/threonine-protein kinase [Actinophytocola oryzae]
MLGALLEQRYRVDALLARGGMSSVYRGLDTRLDRRVAIKVMDERFADDRAFVDRFEREARSAAKIHHPNVVAVHDQGVDRSVAGDLVYLVMELVDGGTLRDLINERGALDVPTTLAIMEPVLAALSAAHRVGLVHRDVKPENVLIGHAGESGATVKVGDFGLVRAVHSAGTTSASVILGTVAYLSPEQVTTGAASSAGDVYSAGVVMFEALTGAAPYTGDSAISVAYRHVNDDVPRPSTLVPGIPAELDDLVVRATRRDQSQRPADGAAFLAEVQKLRIMLGTQRVAVPVPAPTVSDRTIPVTPVERAAALNGGTNLAELPAETTTEQTVAHGQPVSSGMPAVANATIVRQAPAGFRPIGPQGTRAMLRTDLDRANAATEYVPPVGPPSGGFAYQSPQPPPNRPRPKRPVPPPKPKNRTGQIVMWAVIGVVVLALVGTTTWWFTSGRYRTVPSVAGRTSAEAQQILTDNDLNPNVEVARDNTVPAGVVIRTEPDKGQEVLRGDQVTVVVSQGKPKVPDVRAGADKAEIESLLKDQGLTPDYDDRENTYSDTVPKDKVVTTDPQPGTVVNLGQRVVIVVSKGRAPKPVPDVRGQSRDDAFQQLTDDGFQPVEGQATFDQDVEGGHVIRTDPEAGTKINGDDRKVTVTLSNAVTVPNLNGQRGEDARRALQELGLDVDVQHPFGGGGDGGRVFQQSPGGNSRVAAGTKVTLYLFG